MTARVEAVGRRAVAVPADLSDLEAVAGLVDQPGRHSAGSTWWSTTWVAPCPAPSWTRRPGGSSRPSTSTSHRPRPAPTGRAPDAGRRRRLGGQHLLGHGPGAGPRLPGLRDGQGGAGPLHPAGRRRPVPPDPGQRHRRRLGGHLGPGHRHADRRAPRGAWRRAPPSAGSATRRTSPPPSSTWRPRPARTSPARSWRSTAASRVPTSTWASPTCDRQARRSRTAPDRGAPHDQDLPSRRLEHRQCRRARHRRHRRPTRPRAGRACGCPTRTRWGGTPASWPGSAAPRGGGHQRRRGPPRPASRRGGAHRHGRPPADGGSGGPPAHLLAGRGQRRLERTGLPAVPLRRGRRLDDRAGAGGRPPRAASRCS